MEKNDEKIKLLMKVTCKSEAVLNVKQKALTPCPCVHSSQLCFFFHRNAVYLLLLFSSCVFAGLSNTS